MKQGLIRLWVLLLAWPITPLHADTPGQFDNYVLALSWSPDYCASRPDDTQQCTKRLGFVLHGLWPQYTNGYPESCSTERLDNRVKDQFSVIYPSPFLIRHEWEKHGTCAGLSQAGYFALSAQVKNAVKIPADYIQPAQPFKTSIAQLQSAFNKANPGIPQTAVAIACSGGGRFLQEVRICLNRQGNKAMSCSASMQKQMQKSCRSGDFLVRNIR
ncbi:ribonuclease T2 family protein [Leeia oryzae]|uniref:ribonuclease T2 family protein n=1 Tax=Leeia oryzae TaxID=356662 RepID=UPI00036523CE|nr:hypothetical protein [Leeia oryzae]